MLATMVESVEVYTLPTEGISPITINNYSRKSYAGIPRNTFRGSLVFGKGIYKNLNGEVKEDYLVINRLDTLTDYLK